MAIVLPSMTARAKSIIAIALSFLICGAWVALDVGIKNTPPETIDSRGRTMRFNDKLSLEHYAIMARNFAKAPLAAEFTIYDWVFFGMHAAAVLVLSSAQRLTKWFFAGQLFIFPLGLFGILLLPIVGLAILGGGADRELFIDLPFSTFAVHGVWWIASLYILATLKRGPTILFWLLKEKS